MKITRSQLSRIIKEEIASSKKRFSIVREAPYDERDADFDPDNEHVLTIHPSEDAHYTPAMKNFRADVYNLIRRHVKNTGDISGCVEVLNFLSDRMSDEGGLGGDEDELAWKRITGDI